MEKVLQFLREQQVRAYNNQGITICPVADEKAGIAIVLPLLHALLDKQTVLFLSGGKTPKTLYVEIVREGQLHPGAFALVDERYGAQMHENSNEKMLSEVGLLRFATALNIPFYTILNSVISSESASWRTTRNPIATSREISHDVRNDKQRGEIAEAYDQKLRTLLAQYQRHVAILGVGMDGHTAGLPALNLKLSPRASVDLPRSKAGARRGEAGKTQNSKIDTFPTWINDLYERAKNRMVIDYDDKGGPPAGGYKERITMTFQGLSMMDFLLVLVFGKDKKVALELMFSDGSEEEIPSRFFKRSDIVRKTLLITDQMF